MSLASWKKLYYPVAADKVSKKDALDHSIRKWQGLSPAVLKRYGLSHWAGEIEDEDNSALGINSSSCALCTHYFVEEEEEDNKCFACPLYSVRSGVRCDRRRSDEVASPYGNFVCDGDNKPMLRWLRKAKAMVKAKGKAKP